MDAAQERRHSGMEDPRTGESWREQLDRAGYVHPCTTAVGHLDVAQNLWTIIRVATLRKPGTARPRQLVVGRSDRKAMGCFQVEQRRSALEEISATLRRPLDHGS